MQRVHLTVNEGREGESSSSAGRLREVRPEQQILSPSEWAWKSVRWWGVHLSKQSLIQTGLEWSFKNCFGRQDRWWEGGVLSHIKGQSEFLGSANNNSDGTSKHDVRWNKRRRRQEQTKEKATNWAFESSEHKKPHLLRTRRSWIGGH